MRKKEMVRRGPFVHSSFIKELSSKQLQISILFELIVNGKPDVPQFTNKGRSFW